MLIFFFERNWECSGRIIGKFENNSERFRIAHFWLTQLANKKLRNLSSWVGTSPTLGMASYLLQNYLNSLLYIVYQ